MTKSTEAVSAAAARPAPGAGKDGLPLWRRCFAAAKRIEGMVRDADRGELAVLRRLGRPGYPVPGAVAWEFLDRYALEDEHELWTVMLPLMTRAFPVRGSFGYTAHEAGIAPARLERWLRRDRASALREARLLLLRMDTTGIPWGEAGELLHFWDDDERRKRVARDFYRAKRKAARS